MKQTDNNERGRLSRRTFIKRLGLGASVTSLALAGLCPGRQEDCPRKHCYR